VEAVVLCGVQAAGKTTLYVERWLATHVRISQDLLRTQHRLDRFLALCLETRQPFVVDRVNATPADRRRWVAPARAAGFRTVACWLDTPAAEALARNAARDVRARVPVRGLLGTAKRFVAPRAEEGFDEVLVARPDGAGGFVVDRLTGA
jgi:predicted kinase